MLKLAENNKKQLLEKIKNLITQERVIESKIIDCLIEIYEQRLHLEMGYGSLYAFCTEELGLSEGAAFRRIQAMKLTREIPQLKKDLMQGTLNVSQISLAQSFFKLEAKEKRLYTPEEKQTLIHTLKGKTTRECEKMLAQKQPKMMRQEKLTPINPSDVEIRFVADEETQAMLARLKEVCPKKETQIKELIRYALKTTLQKVDPMEKAKRAQEKQNKSHAIKETSAPKSQPLVTSPRRPHIPKQIQHAVWVKAQGQCTYKDPQTGRQCPAKHHLEIDHQKPWALFGEHTLENLTLKCKAHNLYAALKTFEPAIFFKKKTREYETKIE